MSCVARGRARQKALLEFLEQYQAATTDQLAALLWGGNTRLARAHLLAAFRKGLVRRHPHPTYRHGPFVYTRSDRSTAFGQKILHHLQAVDVYLAIVRHTGKYGVRVLSELPWGRHLIPDQTVLYRDVAWAIEHHRTGTFGHAGDYRRFVEEEGWELCSWWRPGIRLGLLVLTPSGLLEHVRTQLGRQEPEGLLWRVVTPDGMIRDPVPWLTRK